MKSQILLKNVFSAFALLLLIAVFAGCGGGVHIDERSPGSDSFMAPEQDAKSIKPLGILKSVRLNWDGVDSTPSEAYLVKIRGRIRETNLFSEVLFEKPLGQYPYVEMEVMFTHTETKNPTANAAKSMVSGITLGLLAPLFPLEGIYNGEMRVKAFRSDGLKKEYHAKSSGTAKAYLSLMNFRFAWDKLVGTVDGNNFNSILTQMVNDIQYFQVNPISFDKSSSLPEA